MPSKSRSHRRTLPIYAVLPFAGILLFGLLNYNFAAPDEVLNYQDSNILLSLIRAGLYLAAGLFFVKNLKRNTSWLVRRFELMVCIVFVLASATWSSHVDRLLIGFLHFVGGILAAYVAAIYFSQGENNKNTFHFLAMVFGLFAIGSLISSVAFPSFGTQYFEWEEVTRWRGLTTNANTLGMACLFAIWSSVAAFMSSENKRWKAIYTIFFLSACVNLWGSDSKTSLIVSVFIIATTILVKILVSGSSASMRKKVIFLIYALLLGGIIVSLMISEKIVATDIVESMGRDSNLSGRDTIWADAIRTFSASPIVGWSFDGRETAYDYIPQEVVHYHNGYLDLAVRGGIVGLSLFLFFVFNHLRALTKMINIDSDYFGPFLAFSLGFLIHNITEASLASFDNIFWILILFSYFVTGREIRRLRRRNTRSKNRFINTPKIHTKKNIGDNS